MQPRVTRVYMAAPPQAQPSAQSYSPMSASPARKLASSYGVPVLVAVLLAVAAVVAVAVVFADKKSSSSSSSPPTAATSSTSSSTGAAAEQEVAPPQLVKLQSFSLPYIPSCWVALPGTTTVFLCNCYGYPQPYESRLYIDQWTVNPAGSAWQLQNSTRVPYIGRGNQPDSSNQCAQGLWVSSNNSLLVTVPSQLTQNLDGTCYEQAAPIDPAYGFLGAFATLPHNLCADVGIGVQISSVVDNGALSVQSRVNYPALYEMPLPSRTVTTTFNYPTSTSPLSMAFYGTNSLYVLLSTSVVSQYMVASNGSLEIGVDTPIAGSPPVSESSRMFFDASRLALLVVADDSVVSFSVDRVSGGLAQVAAVDYNGVQGQCFPAFSAARGFLLNPINGTTVQVFATRPNVVLSPTTVNIAQQPPLPNNAPYDGQGDYGQLLCEVLLVNDTYAAVISSDRYNVVMYEVS
jgi:hypothetical protein